MKYSSSSRFEPYSVTPTTNRKQRVSLTRLVMKLFHHWGLKTRDQVALLGLSTKSRSLLSRYQRGEPLSASQDQLDRASHLLAIHQALRNLFPGNRELAYSWVSTPNRRFEGRTPLQVMRDGGFLGVVTVRRYLDFEGGC